MAVVGEDGCCIATRSKHSGKKSQSFDCSGDFDFSPRNIIFLPVFRRVGWGSKNQEILKSLSSFSITS